MEAKGNQRPFMLHQLVEYILGGALIASGAQSPTPALPMIFGGLIAVHVAMTKGTLAAFRVIPVPLHRVIDPIIFVATFIAGLQPFVEVEFTVRATMGAIAFVQGFVWWNTNFTVKAARGRARSDSATASASASHEPAGGAEATNGDGGLSDRIGRTAGRLAGRGANAVRNRTKSPK